MSNTNLVLIESPFARNKTNPLLTAAVHIQYLNTYLRESALVHNEACYASHKFYTSFLDDTVEKERMLGIEYGLLWGKHADKTVVAPDLGISGGMLHGIRNAANARRPVIVRPLSIAGICEFRAITGLHSLKLMPSFDACKFILKEVPEIEGLISFSL